MVLSAPHMLHESGLKEPHITITPEAFVPLLSLPGEVTVMLPRPRLLRACTQPKGPCAAAHSPTSENSPRRLPMTWASFHLSLLSVDASLVGLNEPNHSPQGSCHDRENARLTSAEGALRKGANPIRGREGSGQQLKTQDVNLDCLTREERKYL